jgi:phosphatidylglycerophosphatase A
MTDFITTSNPSDLSQTAQSSVGVTPTFKWVKDRPWRLFAFGFGSGLSPLGPGTVGTLWAWIATLTYHIFYPSLATSESIVLLIAGLILGIVVCGLTGKELGKTDHGGIVWDEILAFWLILFFVIPCSWIVQSLAFVLFRFFDIAKPGPIRSVDLYFKEWQPSPRLEPFAAWIRGFGVMVDDLFAALATLMVLSILVRFGVISL